MKKSSGCCIGNGLNKGLKIIPGNGRHAGKKKYLDSIKEQRRYRGDKRGFKIMSDTLTYFVQIQGCSSNPPLFIGFSL